MGKINALISLKGGVGKTTLCAALAYNSAIMGKRTLAVDMDFEARSLDLAMGYQDIIQSNVIDVINNTVSLDDAVIKDKRSDSLFFLSSPAFFNESELERDKLLDFINRAKSGYDSVFFDMSAGMSRALEICIDESVIDCAIVVSSHNDASVRAAEKLGSYLADKGLEGINLVINNFSIKDAKKQRAPGIVEIIDRSSVKLLGVVPCDNRVEGNLRYGEIISRDKKSLAGVAALNISRRLVGANVPLLYGVMDKRKRYKLY